MDHVQILLSISIAALAGLLMSRVCKLLKLPAVTGYLIAGILVGGFCLGSIVLPGGYHLGFKGSEHIETLSIISEIALGFIAFSIGSEFRLSELKKTGKQAAVIGIAQAVITSVVCVAVLFGLHYILIAATGVDYLPMPAVLILSAIATATAPAATLMVVRQYKARGPLTNLLLPIVALDDAVGLVVFAVLFGIAKAIGGGEPSVISIVVEPIIEIVASLVLGALVGLVLSLVEKLFHSNGNRLSIVIAFVFAAVAVTQLKNIHIDIFNESIHIGFSSLLTCMMLGTIFCNVCECSNEMMSRADSWTKPLLIIFFVISGAELDLSVFMNPILVLVGVVYIISRCLGKYFGAMSSAALMKCEPSTVKYLGITLFPQAGVALGMVNTVGADAGISPEIANVVRFVILFAVLVYEIFGPVATKWALTKAGDITEKPANSSKRKINLPHFDRHAKHH